MNKRCLVALVSLACFSSYSNETVYGTSGNAAANGFTWSMQNVLPQQAGLTVGNVFYRYTTVKDPADNFLVAVQNEDASGDGYIFRSVDDWSGLPGNTINKLVSVGDIPIERWGNGSIETSGEGIVTNQSIFYTYQYDPCFDPQSDPSCPGYLPEIPKEVFVYDPLQDDLILEELSKESYRENEEEKERQRKRNEKNKKRKNAWRLHLELQIRHYSQQKVLRKRKNLYA